MKWARKLIPKNVIIFNKASSIPSQPACLTGAEMMSEKLSEDKFRKVGKSKIYSRTDLNWNLIFRLIQM